MKEEKSSNIAFCSLEQRESLEAYLKDLLGASRNLLKEQLSKKALAREVRSNDILQLPLDLVNHSRVNPIFSGDKKVEILYEDEHIIALSKPFGVHGHPLAYSETQTVLNFLRFHSSRICWDKFTSAEKGLLYRLDRETSGVVLFVKSASEHLQVRENFHLRVKKKIYYALVEGEVIASGVIKAELAPCGARGSLMRESLGATPASLEIIDSQYFAAQNVSLAKIALHTGLRHQIRVQMSILGHPIVGDTNYGAAQSQRLFLHCYEYALESQSFCSNYFELLGDYLGIDGRLQVFGDELLIR